MLGEPKDTGAGYQESIEQVDCMRRLRSRFGFDSGYVENGRCRAHASGSVQVLLLIGRVTACLRVEFRDAFCRSTTTPHSSSHYTCTRYTALMSRDETPLVRDVPDDETYTHVHRVFLQAFFTHGVMTLDEIKPVLAAIMTAHGPPTLGNA